MNMSGYTQTGIPDSESCQDFSVRAQFTECPVKIKEECSSLGQLTLWSGCLCGRAWGELQVSGSEVGLHRESVLV